VTRAIGDRVVPVGRAAGPGWLLLACLAAASVALLPGVPRLAAGEHGAAEISARSEGVWRVRCGSCHLAFAPELLPRASWMALLAELPAHFGSRVALAHEERVEVGAWLAHNAADVRRSVTGLAVMDRMALSDRPLRVTDTRWFRHRHNNIPRATWASPVVASEANCGACHRDASAGIFDERSVIIPG